MTRRPCVLVFSAATDWSAQRVADALSRRGVGHQWLDPAVFPMRAGLAATLAGGWRGRFSPDTGPDIQWEDVTAVLYRRPRDFQFPESMSAPERSFAGAQARVAIGGILASLPVVWINHPSALADAEFSGAQPDR